MKNRIPKLAMPFPERLNRTVGQFHLVAMRDPIQVTGAKVLTPKAVVARLSSLIKRWGSLERDCNWQ
jgi:hypothetical protein